MDLFIDYRGNTAIERHCQRYRHTENTVVEVEQLLLRLQDAKGKRIRDGKHEKCQERERAYEVAFLRMQLAVRQRLHGSIARLIQSSDTLAAAVKDRSKAELEISYSEAPIAWNNVVCGRELIDKASALYFRLTNYPEEGGTSATCCFAIKRMFDNPVDFGRHFVLAYSGHGSAYRYETADGETLPSPPYMTKEEAERCAGSWESYACTIGGGADVRDIRELTKQAAKSDEGDGADSETNTNSSASTDTASGEGSTDDSK